MNARIKSPSRPLRALAILALTATHLHATLTPPPPPYQDPPLATPIFSADFVTSTEHPEGIGNWFLRFDTLPGYLYSIEETQDLTTWAPSPSGYFYGDGTPMKAYICDGPMPADPALSNGGPGSGSPGQQLRQLHFIITLRASASAPGYHLLRESYTPAPGTYQPDPTGSVNAWDTYLGAANNPDSLPLQAPGDDRIFMYLTYTDYPNNNLWWVKVTVHILPADGTNPAATDDLPTTPEETPDLAIFAKIKPQLIARLSQPPGNGEPDTTPHPHKFARLHRTTPDTNANGLPDWWELLHQYNPFAGNGQPGFCYPGADDDYDGLSNLNEYLYHTDPNGADTDGDGLKDGYEILIGTNPVEADSDGDSLSDGEEILTYHTDPLNSDTDHDSVTDFDEVIVYGTDPNLRDTDGDGYADNIEILYETNPLVAAFHPGNLGAPGNPGGPGTPGGPPPQPSFEPSIVGETRDLLYTFDHIIPPTTNLGITYPSTSGFLSGHGTWPQAPSHFEFLTSPSNRILATALDAKFADMGYVPFPIAADCHNAAAGGIGYFWQSQRYFLPSGFEESDFGYLAHSRIILKIAKPVEFQITKSFLLSYTRSNPAGNAPVQEPGYPKVETRTIIAGQTESAPLDLTPSFAASVPNDGGQTVIKSAIPIEFERDEDATDGNWQPLEGQLAKALPGQKMNLRINTSKLPPGVTLTDYEWTIPGKIFKDYVADVNTAELTKLDPANLKTPEISFYWADSGDKEINVHCKIVGSTAPVEIKCIVRVEKPMIVYTRTLGKVAIMDEVSGLLGVLSQSPKGIKLTAKVEVPEGWPQGRFIFVQTVVPKRNFTLESGQKKHSDMEGDVVLDSIYPFSPTVADGLPDGRMWWHTNETGAAFDSPQSGLVTAIHFEILDEFTTYIMFLPPGLTSSYVPLQVITWGWAATAEKTDGAWAIVAPAEAERQHASEAMDTADHPKWRKNILKQKYINDAP